MEKEDEEVLEMDEEMNEGEINEEQLSQPKKKGSSKMNIEFKSDKLKEIESIKYPSKNHCSICEKIEPPVDIKCNKYCKRQFHSKCLSSDGKDAKNLLDGEY